MEGLVWDEVTGEDLKDILGIILGPDFLAMLDSGTVTLNCHAAKLSFYKFFYIARIDCVGPGGQMPDSLFFLWNRKKKLLELLDGSNNPVYSANKYENLNLKISEVIDYIRFFCFAVRSEGGAFILLEPSLERCVPQSYQITGLLEPLSVTEEDEVVVGTFLVNGKMLYSGIVAQVTFRVHCNGMMEMLDDKPLEVPLSEELLPSLSTLGSLMTLAAYLSNHIKNAGQMLQAQGFEKKTAHLILVELLLEQALAKESGNRLLFHFNAALSGQKPLDQFATLMVKAFPVVTIESNIDFVEEAIGQIISERATDHGTFRIIPALSEPDGISINVTLPSDGPAVALIPLQSGTRLTNVDRIAYELATKDISAVIACDDFNMLPECFQIRADVKLKFPAIDPRTFETLFARTIGSHPPSDWRVLGEDWVRYLMPADFEHPRRMRLQSNDAFDYIHAQVTERLASIDPGTSLGLKDLHGLGEARQFAEDLIDDIHAAIKGKIPWSQVDKGALLIGLPGTGKTTLAKAIAKDCGIKFIAASASSWMAAGDNLGHHIRVIRGTFSEARRYAPAIIFIDEIDSIGNRESFSGSNAQYLTEIVNAVLEQMQGIDPGAPVFVIGATNYVERVDPALRRSGRLDRTINIPLPNTESLEKIYGHYLDLFARDVKLDNSVNSMDVARLSFGLTGADVERIVRGAVRRARKNGRAVNQNDLINELTGKSRGLDGSLRISPKEMERVAYHESGHALASYLSSSHGDNIGFVTIVPRSDGTLGFVANMPEERVTFTQRDYIERIEILLAGRAAEELKYGVEDISSGASSDLKAATNVVIKMVTQLAFGHSGKLLWVESPSVDDMTECEALLLSTYNSVMLKLTGQKHLLETCAKELLLKQELTGDQVRKIFAHKS